MSARPWAIIRSSTNKSTGSKKPRIYPLFQTRARSLLIPDTSCMETMKSPGSLFFEEHPPPRGCFINALEHAPPGICIFIQELFLLYACFPRQFTEFFQFTFFPGFSRLVPLSSFRRISKRNQRIGRFVQDTERGWWISSTMNQGDGSINHAWSIKLVLAATRNSTNHPRDRFNFIIGLRSMIWRFQRISRFFNFDSTFFWYRNFDI